MNQSIIDDLIVALDRAILDGHGALNASAVVAQLAEAGLTVSRVERPSKANEDDDDIYAALARLHEFRRPN